MFAVCLVYSSSRLIGELYRLEMLKAIIMVSCVHKLLIPTSDPNGQTDEESLECLCTLLATIGHRLENELAQKGKVKEHLEPYIARLKKLVDDKKTSSRTRFLIQDVLDMRNNGWQDRKIKEPETYDDQQSRNYKKNSRDESDSYQYSGRPSARKERPIDFTVLNKLRVSVKLDRSALMLCNHDDRYPCKVIIVQSNNVF